MAEDKLVSSLLMSRMRQFNFLALLKKTGAVTLPQPVLIGAILEIVSNYNRSTSEKIKEWGMVGESFLKGSRKSKA